MDFRDLATTEASGLVSRLLAQSTDRARSELETFRKTLDAAMQAAENALADSSRAGSAEDVAGCVERLTAALANEVESATGAVQARAQAAIDAVRAELATLVAAKDTLAAESRALAADRDKLAGERDRLLAEKNKLTHERNRLTGEKDRLSGERDSLADERDRLSGERDRLSSEKDKLAGEKDVLSAERDTLSATLSTERTRAESLETELGKSQAACLDEANARAALRRDLESATASLESTRIESARAASQLKAAAAEHAKTSAALNAAQAQIRSAEEQRKAAEARLEADAARAAVESQAALDRLLDAVQRFSSARTVDDVLAALANGLAKEFARVAVFVVNGNRLEADLQLGFEDDLSKVVMPVTIDSLPTRALSSGALERLTASELADGARAPFGGAPGCAVAFPVHVEGKAVAVLYADDAGESQMEPGPADVERHATFAQLLLGHASLVLAPLARDLKALGEFRQYASTLVNEIEYMYQADVAGGKSDAALQASLRDNVECARRIFVQRVESEAPAAAPLIDEQLVALMHARAASPFGRDLARVAGGHDTAPAHDRSPQAEAS